MQKRTSTSRARMSMDPVRQAYKRRMELIDRVGEVCASGGLTSEALEKFAPESRLIESEIRLDKASSSQFDPAVDCCQTGGKNLGLSIRRTVEPCSSVRANSSKTKVS